MKKFFKTIWKRLFCKHDYWWNNELIYLKYGNISNHQLRILTCCCSKCGKAKEIKFKKGVDR